MSLQILARFIFKRFTRSRGAARRGRFGNSAPVRAGRVFTLAGSAVNTSVTAGERGCRSGPANYVTIENNRFDTNSTDVNTTSGGSGLVVRNNASTGSGNFIALFQTTGALIAANTVIGATATAAAGEWWHHPGRPYTWRISRRRFVI